MILLSCLLAATNLAAVFLLTRNHAKAERAWTQERRELLSRIQHPDRIPPTAGEPFVIPEPEPDELDLVGSIHFKED